MKTILKIVAVAWLLTAATARAQITTPDVGGGGGGGGGGGSYVQNHPLSSSPSCTNPGVHDDVYNGTLAANASYTLVDPATCSDYAIITLKPYQATSGGPYSVNISTAGGAIQVASQGGIFTAAGNPCYDMPTSTSNPQGIGNWQFVAIPELDVWEAFCPGTIPAQAIPSANQLPPMNGNLNFYGNKATGIGPADQNGDALAYGQTGAQVAQTIPDVAFVSGAITTAVTSTNTITVTRPASLVTSNIALVAVWDTGGGATPNPITSTGQAVFQPVMFSNGLGCQTATQNTGETVCLFYYVISNTNPSTWTFQTQTTAATIQAAAVQFSGTTTSFDGIPTVQMGNYNTLISNPVSQQYNYDIPVYFGVQASGSGAATFTHVLAGVADPTTGYSSGTSNSLFAYGPLSGPTNTELSSPAATFTGEGGNVDDTIVMQLNLAPIATQAGAAIPHNGTTSYMIFTGTPTTVTCNTNRENAFLVNAGVVYTCHSSTWVNEKPYDISFPITGAASGYANAQLMFSTTRALHFPANFASTTFPATNSTAGCVTAPGETDTWTLKDLTAATTIGTAALGTTCTTTGINTGVTFATTGGVQIDVAAGHLLELLAPGTVSGSNQSITFAAFTP